MKNYLYLLPFKNEKYFKIGISKDNINRIMHHHMSYGLDLENVYIIEADLPIIQILEIELLHCFPKVKELIGTDKSSGITEVREIKHLDETLEILNNKSKRLKISIKKFSSEELKKEERFYNFSFSLEKEQNEFIEEFVSFKRRSNTSFYHYTKSKAIVDGIALLKLKYPNLKSRKTDITTIKGTKGLLNGKKKLIRSFSISNSDREFIYDFINYKIITNEGIKYGKFEFIDELIGELANNCSEKFNTIDIQ